MATLGNFLFTTGSVLFVVSTILGYYEKKESCFWVGIVGGIEFTVGSGLFMYKKCKERCEKVEIPAIGP